MNVRKTGKAGDVFNQFIGFLGALEAASVSYQLANPRPEALMATIAVPGERWEVEFFADGTVEIERFRSSGEIGDASLLDDLWRLAK